MILALQDTNKIVTTLLMR